MGTSQDSFRAFLYPENTEFCKPQMAICPTGDRSAAKWYPAAYPNPAPNGAKQYEQALKSGLIGYGPRMYRDYRQVRNSAEYLLAWICIDIDDVEGLDEFNYDVEDADGAADFLGSLTKKIKAVCPAATIRTSTSGTGLHLLFRLDKLYHFKAGENCKNHRLATLKPQVEALKKIGVEVCEGGLRAHIFYFSGGLHKGETLRVSPLRIPLLNAEATEIMRTNASIETEGLRGKALDFVEKINDSGALISGNQIYVKALYNALKNTEFEFKTLSPMASQNPHINGFITIDGFEVKIFTSADGAFVLRADEFKIEREEIECKN